MAWERRRNQFFYYRSVRVGRKVKKVYLGKGPAAEIAAELDALARAARKARTVEFQQKCEEFKQAETALVNFCDHVETLLRTKSTAAGSMSKDTNGRNAVSSKSTTGNSPRLASDAEATSAVDDVAEQFEDGADACVIDKDHFQELVEKANNGDKEALTQMQKVLDEQPLIWGQVGDLAAHARLSLIRAISGGDKLLFESVTRKTREMETELAGESPSLVERLAVERVVSCWLHMQHADTMSVVAAETLGQARYWSQRQDQAHRRYTAALNQLTALQQLSLSTAQASTESSNESLASAKRANPAAEQGTTNGNGQQQGDLPIDAAATHDTDTDANSAASGNGEAPSQVPEDNGQVNGQPVNRILRFADPVVKV